MEKTKTVDCIRLKRRGARKIYQQLQTMTKEQQLAFWQAHTFDLQRHQEQLKREVIQIQSNHS